MLGHLLTVIWRYLNVSLLLICHLCFFYFPGCSDDQNFVTKTIGQSATLTCTHQRSQDVETLFWIKLVAGNLPDILGKASSFDEKNVKEISHMILKQEPGRFVLNITETRLTDTAFYYCLKSRRFNITFLKGVFLRVEGKYIKNKGCKFINTMMIMLICNRV